ncbi:MAG: type III-B CRISPR-associated protein Cas10/Cmr2 [Sulfurovum sp.]|nr:type III-B CRISPR-associated protein Cas10/Cmr2 [Sulfurovum sp.]
MPKTNPYTILSIGPIYDTMQIADNTRAVWTASYIFSYIMQTTIINVRSYLMEEYKKSEETEKDYLKKHFVVPSANADFIRSGNRVGLFHDRLILKGEHAKCVNIAFKKAVDDLTNVVLQAFEYASSKKYVKLRYEETKVKKFIKGYFHSYIAQVELKDDDNPILELSKYVDTIEYEPRLALHEDKEYLFYFFRVANLALTKHFAFFTDADDNEKNRCFKSLPEIAAWEHTKEWAKRKEYFCLTIDKLEARAKAEKSLEDDAEDIYAALKTDFGKALKPYHKYIAIVHADGDAFGKYLEKIGSDEKEIQSFSDNIFKFSRDAAGIIESGGGLPIVAGGDDLVFFAPVVCGEDNIFTLINEIDKKFRTYFDDDTLSMSYGVSITYYKYPLQEAMELSAKALWDEAKETKWVKRWCFENHPQIPDASKAKNAIHLNIQKHSGQSHSLTLHKDTELYTQFITLLSQELDAKDTLHLPHALHHSLDRVATVIDKMPVDNIEHFFTNMFNENVHKSAHQEALEAIQKILRLLKEDETAQAIHRVYTDDNGKEYIKNPSKTIFSILATIKMLRGDA